MDNHQKKIYNEKRTEEVQHIIDRMPTSFGYWITLIIAFLAIIMVFFGYYVRYPDIVIGNITINTNRSPLKLIANSNGKLKLSFTSMQDVKEGDVIAYVENQASPQNVLFIDSLIKTINVNSDQITGFNRLPKNYSLGELNVKYYTLTKSLQDLINLKDDRLLETQTENLSQILQEQQNAILSAKKGAEMGLRTVHYQQKFYTRDSLLYKKKVISESELDKSHISYISSNDSYQRELNNLSTSYQAAQQTKNKLLELEIQKPEKEKELRIAVLSAYNDLRDNIKIWKQKYLFISPYAGKVQFLKFYVENQFIQAGDQVFTIIPKQEKEYGQVTLPAVGSGKVNPGQEVIVKMDSYPYMEYGTIKGTVSSISLTTSLTKTDKSDIDTYQVVVKFPNDLKTNYGTKLTFRAEAKGVAEIITNDRRLIQRFFDNMKYIVKR